MRSLRSRGWLPGLVLAGVLVGLLGQQPARAGGPLAVGGTFGVDGQPFTWSTATEVQYTTDGGNLGILNNATANTRVAGMFQVWEDVPTAAIGFNRLGPITGVADGDVDTMPEFNAVAGACDSGSQSPIVYDVDGSLFADLGRDPSVIGFAGPCALTSGGRIASAIAALNGKFRDGAGPGPGEPELTDNEFDAVFIHEFGHFAGLDHSQINVNCITAACSLTDDASGRPTMFPFLTSGLQETPGVHPDSTLATDDIAWISRLYPEVINNPPTRVPFNSQFATISGTILFSDGITHIQGVNVITRQVSDGNPLNGDESRRIAVSTVSGYLFTGNFGQSVTGTNQGDGGLGSHNPSLIGTFDIPVLAGSSPTNYRVEVEEINPAFEGGSSVGPLDPPIPKPGPNEFWDVGESNNDNTLASSPVTVTAGATVTGINVILNFTPPRFDAFEGARLRLLEPMPVWIRKGNFPADLVPA